MMLRLGFLVLVPWGLATPALQACSCAYRGPVCKWFPNSTDPAFVGRVIEMEPGSDWEFRILVESALRPYIGDAIAVHPQTLEGEAFALYVRVYRDFWRSIIAPEALDKLSNVADYGELVAWQRTSGLYGGQRRVRFLVSEVFAGEVAETIDVYTRLGGGTACSPSFETGQEYLVYARGGPDQWQTSTCAGGGEVSRRREDLEYLRSYGSAGTLGSFTGIAYVRNWNPDGYAESSPADGAEIEIFNQGRSWKTRADEDGRFSISGLQRGGYSVSAQHQGQPLSLGPAGIPETEPIQDVPAGGCAFVQFSRPEPSGSITGRVFGPTTEALAGISVNAVPTDSKFPGRYAQTDQDGRFEIKELKPGGYFVGVNIDGPPTARQPYGTLYYPGVPGREAAAALQVGDDAITDAGVLALGRRMGVRKVFGKVVGADGKPLSEIEVNLMLEGFSYGVGRARTGEDGSFELEGLEETAYTARAEFRNARNGSVIEAEVAAPSTGNAPITIVLVLP